jgi:hypothetical protein
MPQPNPTSRVQFNTLKIISTEAMADLNDRLREARADGNDALARDLIDAIRKLMDRMLEIRRAEIAYLNSTLADTTAMQRLQTAIRNADLGLKKMQDLATALEGASKLISVLTRLARLFA